MKKLACLLLSFLFCVPLSTYAQQCVWAKQSLGDKDCFPRSVVTDAAGNVYTMGSYTSLSVTFGAYTLNNTDTYSTNIFLVKYNSSGTVLWAKTFGDSVEDIAYGMAIDASGSLYIAGNFSSRKITFGGTILHNVGGDDIFITKLDGNGNVLWAKQATCGPGGDYFNEVTGLAADASGHIVIAGYLNNTVTFGSITLIDGSGSGGGINAYVAKLDTAGNVIWAKTSTGTGSGYFAGPVTVDGTGNIYLAGNCGSGPATFDAVTFTGTGAPELFLIKFNSSGTAQWARTVGNTLCMVEARGIATDPSGNVCIAGGFDCPIVTFGTTILTNAGTGSDIFVAKYDPSGTVIWAKSIGGTGEDKAYALAADALGNMYITGTFISSLLPFDTVTLTEIGLFVSKLNAAGNVVWAKSGTTLNSAGGYAITPDGLGNLYVTGDFNTLLTIDTITLTPALSGYVQAFTAKFIGISAGITPVVEGSNDITISPNPACNELTIAGSEKITTINICNLTGATVYAANYDTQKLQLNIAALPQGMYMVKINGTVVRKFIKL